MSAMRSLARRCFAAALLSASSVFAGGPSSPAAAEEWVRFESAAVRASQAEDGGAPAGSRSIRGALSKPKGEGPFPAVVLLHSCLGLPETRRSIADMFANWGYVALFVDDFTTRGLKETCARDFNEGASDAYGALAYLSELGYVDSRRVAAVGYSQGADTALQIASRRLAPPRDLNFKAAVAFYPPCANQANARLAMPTLILIGESDDVTPAADCARLASGSSGAPDVKLVVYPGAYHGFDNPGLAGGKRLFGMWLEYDAAAAERSKSEMRNFLAARLTR
jgi:dienelactone hydrolase